MNQKSTAVFAITACLLVAANTDQGLLDCRKLVYSRNCRGVAIKRGDSETGETQSGIQRDGLSLKRLMYDLGSSNGYSLVDDAPSLKKVEDKRENRFQKDKMQLDHLLFKLFSGNRRKNNENDYFPFYDY